MSSLWSRVRTILSASSLRAPALAWGVCLVTVLLVYLGYRATAESQQRARQLLERRAAEQFALLWAGLNQDMRGAQETVLLPVTRRQLVLEPPYDLAEVFARGFARFPYPESFFAWKPVNDGGEVTYVFNRSHRPPPWQTSDPTIGPYPVEVLRDSPAVSDLIAHARLQARDSRPVTAFETRIGEVTYQVIVRFFYRGDDPPEEDEALLGLVGFTVNLDWVRRFYFHELSVQISRIGGDPADVSLSVLDETGALVTETGPARQDIPALHRSFPLWFADRALLRTVSSPEHVRYWTANAAAAQHSQLAATALGTSGTLVLISLAGVFGVVALLMTARGARVASELAVMKADFVSSVTHELKTPLSVIQLIADTLWHGRYDSPDTVRHYAKLLWHESGNFTRLIENLLAYARLSDSANAYLFVPTHVGELVEDAVDKFQVLLFERQFTVTIAVPDDLPAVRADRSALLQVLDNLIDNSIKYSDATRMLEITARADAERVTISVADAGVGIPQDEIERVCEKFFRGRGVRVGGSGLGLAIAGQIIKVHRGSLRIQSAPGKGTRIDLTLPAVSA
jgi:signal transduction histidine kinase